jgi:hypothetical protein
MRGHSGVLGYPWGLYMTAVEVCNQWPMTKKLR